jgi:hypothetical protein
MLISLPSCAVVDTFEITNNGGPMPKSHKQVATETRAELAARSRIRRAVCLKGLGIILTAGVLASGCGSGQDDARKLGATSQALDSEKPKSPVEANAPFSATFDLLFPATFGLSRVTVAASEEVEIGERAKVRSAAGAGGIVTAVGGLGGGQRTKVGERANVGDVIAGGDVSIEERATAGVVSSARSVRVNRSATVTAIRQNISIAPVARRTMTARRPNGIALDALLLRNSSKTLAPGPYKRVSVERGAVLLLTSGTYMFDALEVERDGALRVDTTGGTVTVYVREKIDWEGAVIGDGSRFVLGYLGQTSLSLTPGFTGTALAPFAQLKLTARDSGADCDSENDKKRSSCTPAVHKGVYYGKSVKIEEGASVEQLPSAAFIIDNVRVSNAAPCIGEPIEVTVDAPTVAGGAPGAIRIMDIPGPRNYVQFANAPGPRFVFASVTLPDGRSDSMGVPVTARACALSPAQAPPVAMHFWGATGRPNTVQFVVRDYDTEGHEVTALSPASYAWVFGDGSTITTTEPSLTHDYSSSVLPMNEYSYFTAKVTVTRGASSSSVSVQKVVPIWSLYAFNRAKGIVRPEASIAIEPARYSLTLKNLETTPLAITGGFIELMPCDPALAVTRLPTEVLSASVPAGGSATVALTAPADVPGDICSVGVHALGRSVSGAVYADAYARTQENKLLRRRVTKPATLELLNRAATLTKSPDRWQAQRDAAIGSCWRELCERRRRMQARCDLGGSKSDLPANQRLDCCAPRSH